MLSVRSPVLSWTVTVAKGCPSVSRTVPRRLAGFSWPWRTSDARTQAAKRAGRFTAEVEVIVAEIVPRPRSLKNASWRTHSREHLERKVGRTPWSAADAHVGLLGKVGPGDPRGRARPPTARRMVFITIVVRDATGTLLRPASTLVSMSARRRDQSRRSRLRVCATQGGHSRSVRALA